MMQFQVVFWGVRRRSWRRNLNIFQYYTLMFQICEQATGTVYAIIGCADSMGLEEMQLFADPTSYSAMLRKDRNILLISRLISVPQHKTAKVPPCPAVRRGPNRISAPPAAEESSLAQRLGHALLRTSATGSFRPSRFGPEISPIGKRRSRTDHSSTAVCWQRALG